MKSKLYIFLVNGKPVEQIDGKEICHDELVQLKSGLACIHNVPFDEIEVDSQDIIEPEVSRTLFVTDNGLQFRADNPYASLRSVDSPVPSLDIRQSDLFDEFLELILQKDIDNAITFI
ncbi:MAG: hypothetical protein IT215_01115 [Chitinophagaceae bacterium]|nr:hypothetical protein [Chitinophagaceae bacterium]